MKDIIRKYFKNQVSIEEVCRKALSENYSPEKLIEEMRRWKVLNESEHAEDLTLLTKEAEATIKAIMGDKK